MDPAAAIILGFLQGVFEWLPVSSEAVITLVTTQLLGLTPTESVNTAIYLHTGTMLAALVYFRQDFIEILGDVPDYLGDTYEKRALTTDYPIINFLGFSTFFTGIVGGTIYLAGMEALPSNPRLFTAFIGVALFFTGIIKLGTSASERDYLDVNLLDSIEVGVLQGLAVIPGISRSGVTVFGLFVLDFDSDDAFKLSFLMSVPAILVAQVGINLFSGFQLTPMLLLSAATAFVVGYLSIEAILEIAERVEVAYLAFFLAFLAFIAVLI